MTGGGAFLVISSGVGLSCSQQLYKMANPSGHTSLVLCAFISVLSVALGSAARGPGAGRWAVPRAGHNTYETRVRPVRRIARIGHRGAAAEKRR